MSNSNSQDPQKARVAFLAASKPADPSLGKSLLKDQTLVGFTLHLRYR